MQHSYQALIKALAGAEGSHLQVAPRRESLYNCGTIKRQQDSLNYDLKYHKNRLAKMRVSPCSHDHLIDHGAKTPPALFLSLPDPQTGVESPVQNFSFSFAFQRLCLPYFFPNLMICSLCFPSECDMNIPPSISWWHKTYFSSNLYFFPASYFAITKSWTRFPDNKLQFSGEIE